MAGTFRAGWDDVGKNLNFSVATLSAWDLQQLQVRQRSEAVALGGRKRKPAFPSGYCMACLWGRATVYKEEENER